MAARTRITVAYDKGDGAWSVKGADGTSTHRTKTKAVSEAARMGRKSGKAQVIIKKRDGKIESERTYGRDPRRTKG